MHRDNNGLEGILAGPISPESFTSLQNPYIIPLSHRFPSILKSYLQLPLLALHFLYQNPLLHIWEYVNIHYKVRRSYSLALGKLKVILEDEFCK